MINDSDRGSLVEQSSDPTLTRQEFIRKVAKGAVITGGLLAAPKVIDKFLIPAAYAGCSTDSTGVGCTATDATTANGNIDSADKNSNNLTCGTTDGCVTSHAAANTGDTHCATGGTSDSTGTLVCS